MLKTWAIPDKTRPGTTRRRLLTLKEHEQRIALAKAKSVISPIPYYNSQLGGTCEDHGLEQGRPRYSSYLVKFEVT